MDVFTIYYYDNKEEKNFEVELCFLTAALSQQIIEQDLANQKLFRELISKQRSNIAKAQQSARESLTEYLRLNPNTSEEERQTFELALNLSIILRASDEDLIEATEYRIAELGYKLKSIGDIFKLLINRNKLDKEINSFIDSNYNSDFWQNVDISRIEETVNSFRLKHKV